MGRRIRDREAGAATETPAEVKKEDKVETPAAKTSTFSVEKKIEEIRASNLPEQEKERYIRQLTGDKGPGENPDRVPFTVWANVRGIKENVRKGMLAHPKGKAQTSATFAEWDEIFKDF